MFGRKETEKRSLEDMFKPIDEVVESVDDEETAYDLNENQKVGNVGNTEKNSCVPINPFSCFGIEEGKTEKWLGKCVKFWYCVMSFLWFVFGAVTFAPVIFISNKVSVIFKDKRNAVLASSIIYVACIVSLIVFV